MNLKTKLRALLTAICFCCAFSLVQAQGPGDPGEDPDPSVPIDGGLSLLIAAGVGYAAKKGYDKRKKDNLKDDSSEKES